MCAPYSQTIRPPQQKPVIPSRLTSALPVPLAQATVASRSDMTCASGTLETTLRISWKAAELRDVALAGVHLGGDGEVAELGEPAADVLDVLVDAEDLLDDEDHGQVRAAGRHGAVGGDLAVGDGDLHLAGLEAVGVGRDRLGGDGLGGHREAGGQRGHHELASRTSSSAGPGSSDRRAWQSFLRVLGVRGDTCRSGPARGSGSPRMRRAGRSRLRRRPVLPGDMITASSPAFEGPAAPALADVAVGRARWNARGHAEVRTDVDPRRRALTPRPRFRRRP